MNYFKYELPHKRLYFERKGISKARTGREHTFLLTIIIFLKIYMVFNNTNIFINQ